MNADSRASTEPAASLDANALIDEALKAAGILPPYDRLVELDEQLRTVMAERLRVAEDVAAGMNRGTPEWWSCQSAIDAANAALRGDLGIGLRSAALHVSELARCCYALQGRR